MFVCFLLFLCEFGPALIPVIVPVVVRIGTLLLPFLSSVFAGVSLFLLLRILLSGFVLLGSSFLGAPVSGVLFGFFFSRFFLLIALVL